MTATRAAVAAVLAATVCTLFAAGMPHPSYACECYARTPEEYFNDADAVFAGTVVDIDRIDDGGDDDYELTFNVSQYWKGLSENDRLVTAHLDSFDGNVCGYPFQEGEEYLTYASVSNGQLRVGGCYGTSPIADAGDSVSALAEPDPLDGAAPASTPDHQKLDLTLISITAAIALLSAGIAVLVLKKPKR